MAFIVSRQINMSQKIHCSLVLRTSQKDLSLTSNVFVLITTLHSEEFTAFSDFYFSRSYFCKQHRVGTFDLVPSNTTMKQIGSSIADSMYFLVPHTRALKRCGAHLKCNRDPFECGLLRRFWPRDCPLCSRKAREDRASKFAAI